MPDLPVVGQAGHDTLSIIVGFSLAWMIASQFDRKSVQTERSELMEADKNEPSSITERSELMETTEIKHSSINSPLKMFGTTVVPPFAIAKPFNAALLAGVRVA